MQRLLRGALRSRSASRGHVVQLGDGGFAFALRGPDRLPPTVDILVRPVVAFEDVFSRAVAKNLGGFSV